MNDKMKTREQLVAELMNLRARLAEMELRNRIEANQRHNRETAERLSNEQMIIAEIGRLISSTLHIDEVYERFAAETSKLIPFDWLSVTLEGPHGDTVRIAYVSGIDIPGRRKGDTFPKEISLTGVVMRTRSGLLLLLENIDEMAREYPFINDVITVRAGMRSLMSVPLVSNDKAIGVLNFRSKKPKAYIEQDLHLAEIIGRQIAGAVANARLYADLQETERSLRESEERFRMLVETAPDAIYVHTQRQFTYLNRAALELFGATSEDQLLGRPVMSRYHHDYHAVINERINALYEKKVSAFLQIPQKYLKLDGTPVDVDVSGVSLIYKGQVSALIFARDVTERKKLEQELLITLNKLEVRVKERTIELEEINTALRVLLKKREEDQRKLEQDIQSNIRQLVEPFLTKLKFARSDEEKLAYLNIIETNLGNVVSPFVNQLSASYKSLTPKEIQIAALIKDGKSSKEIAALLSVSVGTVITHRNSIRRKLKLKSKDANLRSHLLSLI